MFQTASWSVQPFLHSSQQGVPVLYFPPKLPISVGGWLQPHLIQCSLGPPESISQTVSWSVQPFLYSSRQTVTILYNGWPFSTSKLPLRKRIWTPIKTQFLWPTRVHTLNGISIGSAVLRGSWFWQTNHATLSVTTGDIYMVLQCGLITTTMTTTTTTMTTIIFHSNLGSGNAVVLTELQMDQTTVNRKMFKCRSNANNVKRDFCSLVLSPRV